MNEGICQVVLVVSDYVRSVIGPPCIGLWKQSDMNGFCLDPGNSMLTTQSPEDRVDLTREEAMALLRELAQAYTSGLVVCTEPGSVTFVKGMIDQADGMSIDSNEKEF